MPPSRASLVLSWALLLLLMLGEVACYHDLLGFNNHSVVTHRRKVEYQTQRKKWAIEELYTLTGAVRHDRFESPPESPPEGSTECLDAIFHVLNGTYDNSTLMYLSSGTSPGDYGNYLECQVIPAAHFCTIRYKVYNITTVLLSSGLCIPSVCTAQDIVWALHEIPNPSWIPFFNTTDAVCVPKKHPPLTPGGIATLVVICILASFVLIGTFWDLVRRWRYIPDIPLASPIVERGEYRDKALSPSPSTNDLSINGDGLHNDHHSNEDMPHHQERHEAAHNSDGEVPPPTQIWMQMLFSFSVAVNMERLVKHFPDSKTNLNPLNMVRVVAMLWVVLGHTCLFTTFIGYSNSVQAMTQLIPTPAFQVILNATLSVDVFFYLSGFLMTYFTLKELRQKHGRMNWLILLLHRLWRMTPTMLLALFFCWTLAPSMGNGPWWKTFMSWTTDACKKYWWTNVLFINNFWHFDLEQTCLAWTWYMSIDMQFFLIAIPLVYLIYKWPKLGFCVVGALAAGSLAYVAGISTTHHFSPIVLDMDDGWRVYIYTKPWARISTFLIGIVGAYLLLDHEERALSPHGFRGLPTFQQSLLVTASWIISIVMILVPVFAPFSAYQPNAHPWSTGAKVAYLTLSRPCFTIGLAIMAHLVMTSRASVSLKHALSHPLWTPFARLTFGAYLYHPIIMFAYYFSSTRPIDFTGTMVFQNFVSFTVLAFVASLVSFLLIERPTENLESIAINWMKQRAKVKAKRRSVADVEQRLLSPSPELKEDEPSLNSTE